MSLEDLWRRQLAFTSHTQSVLDKSIDKLTEDDKIRLTKEYLLYIHSELSEVLGNIPWKTHRYTGQTNRESLLEELVDVTKFLWGLMVIWGVSPQELERAFDRKSDIVEQRFRQDHVLPKQFSNNKLVIIDIDDVIADWEQGFIKWVQDNEPNIKDGSYNNDVDPVLRQQLKDKMHSSGGMKELSVILGSHSAIEALGVHGYEVVWLTARPIGKHPRLIGDTIQWLKDHNIKSDFIYFSDLNKHIFIAEKFPTAAAIFDDKIETCSNAKSLGLKAYNVTRENSLAKCVFEFLKEA